VESQMPAYDAPARRLTEAELATRIQPILETLAVYRQRAAAYDGMVRQLRFSRRLTLERVSDAMRGADLRM
jgi:hypothetical protein